MDRNENGSAESRSAEYDAIAERILSYRAATGQRPGIYGANRCQLCGTITPFSTLLGAQMSHFGPDRDRVCAPCLTRCGRDGILAVIATRTERRCEVCGCSVKRSRANRLGPYWICKPCRRDVSAGDSRFGPADGLHQLVRRRYMELAYLTVEDLLELEEAVLQIQADLDAISSHSTTADEPGDADEDGGPATVIIVGLPSSGRLR